MEGGGEAGGALNRRGQVALSDGCLGGVRVGEKDLRGWGVRCTSRLRIEAASAEARGPRTRDSWRAMAAASKACGTAGYCGCSHPLCTAIEGPPKQSSSPAQPAPFRH